MTLNDILESLTDVSKFLELIALNLDQKDFTTAMQLHTAATNTTVMNRIAEILQHLPNEAHKANERREPYE